MIRSLQHTFSFGRAGLVAGIGDDAAVVKINSKRCALYTADMLIESVHFKKKEDPVRIGYKALAVSVSDIAAMGGYPKYALLSVGLPSTGSGRVMKGLMRGVKKCADRFGVVLIGGDTNRSPVLVLDSVVIGEVEREHLVMRQGSRSGDHIFVSGSLGGSIRGKHLDFIPRVDEARFLTHSFKPTAMMDISDGLGMDLNRMTQVNLCGALIHESKIPVADKADSIDSALFDGEDFELLFTLRPKDALRLTKSRRRRSVRGVRFTEIGRMTDLFRGVKMICLNGRTRRIGPGGFQHFK